jgi:hypothetical protein
VQEQILGYQIMHLRIGSVYNKIYIVSAEKLGIIGKNVTAVFLGGSRSAEIIALNNAYNLAKIIHFTLEEATVDVSSASALTDYGNSQFFHIKPP